MAVAQKPGTLEAWEPHTGLNKGGGGEGAFQEQPWNLDNSGQSDPGAYNVWGL